MAMAFGIPTKITKLALAHRLSLKIIQQNRNIDKGVPSEIKQMSRWEDIHHGKMNGPLKTSDTLQERNVFGLIYTFGNTPLGWMKAVVVIIPKKVFLSISLYRTLFS